MAGGSKNKLEYMKQDTPKFLRDFKARVGYKEGPTVDTKKQTNVISNNEDDDIEREDEKPTICVLKEGDITAEEYAKYEQKYKKTNEYGEATSNQDDDAPAGSSKILFKKPLKRKNEKEIGMKMKNEQNKDKKKKKASKTESNKKLLSFAENDED